MTDSSVSYDDRAALMERMAAQAKAAEVRVPDGAAAVGRRPAGGAGWLIEVPFAGKLTWVKGTVVSTGSADGCVALTSARHEAAAWTQVGPARRWATDNLTHAYSVVRTKFPKSFGTPG